MRLTWIKYRDNLGFVVVIIIIAAFFLCSYAVSVIGCMALVPARL